eukprot:c13407_g1_i1 orf=447-3056(-)
MNSTAMAGDDDMDSLFAGMDFVNTLSFSDAEASAPSSPPPLSTPLDLHDFSETQHTDLTPTSLTDIQKSLDNSDQKAKPHSSDIDSILAAYNSTSTKVQPSMVRLPSLSKQSPDASKPGVRRKRRSMKIGYGRSAVDDADEVRSVSTQDETASNGSTIDEQSIGLPELISVTHDGIAVGRHETMISSMRNGENGDHRDIFVTSDVHDANHEEPFDNLTALTEPIDVDLHTSEVQTLDLGMACSNPDDVSESSHVPAVALKASETKAAGLDLADDEAELGEAMALKKDSSEVSFELPQSENASKTPPSDNIDQDLQAANAPSIKSTIASNTLGPESDTDVLELEINVPLGLSMEEKLGFIKEAVATNAHCIQRRIASISQARKSAAQKRRQMAEKMSRTSANFKEVEEEIQAACEREDFEKADELDEALVLAETAREAALEEFRAVETEYDKYSSKMEEVIQMQITNEEESFLLLERLGQDAADAADHLKKDSEDEGRTKIDALATEEVAFKLEKEKLMLEVQKVEEAKSLLTSTIESSIQTESEEKQTLVEERQVLLEELDALLAAVRLKETQIAEQDKRLGDLEEKINSRVAGFQKEGTELETNLQNLKSELDNLEKESEGLEARKVQVEAEVVQAQEAAEKLLELSTIAKLEAQKLQDSLLVRKAAAQTAQSSKEKRLSLAAQEKQHVEDVHGLRNQSSSLRTTLQDIASEKMKLHQELLVANQQMSSIEKRVPELEAEKKLAAGSRNFKEAGRLAAEAKALLSSKEKLVSEVKRVTAGLQALDQELESHMSELSELEDQLQLKEREAAMARYERLRLLAMATRDERDAAAELEDSEEAKSLDVEAEAADREADEIKKQYGLNSDVC